MCDNDVMTDYSEFAPTKIAHEGIQDEVKRLMKDEGMSESDALRVAASTMSGAGDNPAGTVESVQTCTDLEGRSVPGLTGDDVPSKRTDPYAETEGIRHKKAEAGQDEADEWLKKNDPKYSNPLSIS